MTSISRACDRFRRDRPHACLWGPALSPLAASTGDLYLWASVALGLIFAGVVVVVVVRRWARTEIHADSFTVGDLREMLARGDITEPEFRAMRSRIIEQVRADLQSQPPAKPAPRIPPDE